MLRDLGLLFGTQLVLNGFKYRQADCRFEGHRGEEENPEGQTLESTLLPSVRMSIAIKAFVPVAPGLNDVLAGGNVPKSALINGTKIVDRAGAKKPEDHCQLNGVLIVFQHRSCPWTWSSN